LATERSNYVVNGSEITASTFVSRNPFPEQGHGEEIGEIVSKRPPFIVVWGTVIFLAFLVLIAIVCWLVQYPDIVVANARLNSVNAPREVVTRTDGRLIRLAVKEGQKVASGQVLGYMESIADPASVFRLESRVDSAISLIGHNRTDEIIKYFSPATGASTGPSTPATSTPATSTPRSPIPRQSTPRPSTPGPSPAGLGELQGSYQTFMQTFGTFRDFLKDGFYLRKKEMLSTDLANIEKLNAILLSQKELIQQDLSLSNATMKSAESLINDKVISPLDYRNEKSKLIAKQLTLPQVNASIVANESQHNEKRKEIAELENQIVIQKNTFIQSLATMKSQILAWEYKYVLKAPVSGSVSYTGFFQENQELRSAQAVFNIQPDSTSYFMEALIPQYNFGKVRPGQKVLLKFRAYPFEQYGSVTGKIDFINASATDSGYLAKITLPNGLVTNYQQQLLYRNGLAAQADIITENMRLLQKFYYNIARQVRR